MIEVSPAERRAWQRSAPAIQDVADAARSLGTALIAQADAYALLASNARWEGSSQLAIEQADGRTIDADERVAQARARYEWAVSILEAM